MESEKEARKGGRERPGGAGGSGSDGREKGSEVLEQLKTIFADPWCRRSVSIVSLHSHW